MDEMKEELKGKMTQNSVANMLTSYLHHANKTTKNSRIKFYKSAQTCNNCVWSSEYKCVTYIT